VFLSWFMTSYHCSGFTEDCQPACFTLDSYWLEGLKKRGMTFSFSSSPSAVTIATSRSVSTGNHRSIVW
jgi:hypothetical protein